MMKNTKDVGNGWFEAKCDKCGEVMTFTKGDDMFADIRNGDTYPLCSRCYDGPRGKPKQKPPKQK